MIFIFNKKMGRGRFKKRDNIWENNRQKIHTIEYREIYNKFLRQKREHPEAAIIREKLSSWPPKEKRLTDHWFDNIPGYRKIKHQWLQSAEPRILTSVKDHSRMTVEEMSRHRRTQNI